PSRSPPGPMRSTCASSCATWATGPVSCVSPTSSEPASLSKDRTDASRRSRREPTPARSCGSPAVSGPHRPSASSPRFRQPLLPDCGADAASAPAIAVLRAAAADGRITLELVESAQGRRLGADLLAELVGGDLTGAHVAVCGPKGLVSMVERTAGSLGASHVE